MQDLSNLYFMNHLPETMKRNFFTEYKTKLQRLILLCLHAFENKNEIRYKQIRFLEKNKIIRIWFIAWSVGCESGIQRKRLPDAKFSQIGGVA